MRSRFWMYSAAAVLAVAGLGHGAPTGLADDGRVGVVADLQGAVLVQPAGRQRWSPVGADTVLLPGDQVRTLPRGANAAEIRLADGGSLVLGAGGLVRLTERGALHLVRGDAELTGSTGMPVRVTGPGEFEQRVTDTVVLRATDDATSTLEQTPRWLEGYRGSTTDEWMGSLVAKVDGRNVPLSVGYHKVDVVIRDQIAVTTVEESFVNSTSSRLEGVFSFPLPAGASISGFGMWIGDELVEADIVERQRARQIYEDIRARRKDPGLLEWSGGNVFKASVFPIPAHGEKRIRLRYTQVLPLEGSRVRYRYALRSELLRTNPLRRLQISVRHHSSAVIETASSPTHDVQVTKTANDATLTFSAEEFVPERDFEAVFALERSDPLRVVPHRRGDDGYFMLLLAPPDAAAGEWERELVPEGDPLDVLFIADTSGSMSPVERLAQRDFISAALALLGPDDRFRLMACDALTAWPAAEPLAVTDKNVQLALTALDRRFSLGWSDLDAALAEAVSHATERTLVVYVGDGIGTTGDADPIALAQRIRRMRVPAGVAFHAVATGSEHEEGVLDAIASLGGGSSRSIDGDAARAAYTLLSEVAQPPVKDLAISFEGVRTARVYPERLPSVPAGTQQIVLGRFLPTGDGPQSGKVVVTGTRDGKPVRFAADLTVAEEEEGNSFLPRLWARKHLDALLAEGRSQAIQDEIVSFSERFGIMTPYTSLLVLENDEDRERYGVARRVHMRDGDRFFADARTAVDTAALREQVAKARSWRLALRRRMLAEISGLGRGLYTQGYGYAYGRGGGAGGGWRDLQSQRKGGYYRGPAGEAESGPVIKDAKTEDHNETDSDLDDFEGLDEEIPPDSRDPFDPPPPGMATERAAKQSEPGGEWGGPAFRSNAPFDGPAGPGTIGIGGGAGGAFGYRRDRELSGGKRAGYESYAPWLGNLVFQRFPGLPAPAVAPTAPEQSAWDDDVRALLASVSGGIVLPDGTDVGVRVRMVAETPRTGALAGLWSSRTSALVASDRWHARTSNLGQEPLESWAVEERGSLAVGQRLGRRRAATEDDRDDWVGYLGIRGADYLRSHAKWSATIESREGPLVTVLLTPPKEQGQPQRLVIDAEKHVLVRQDSLLDGKVTWSQVRGEFVLAGGTWWPGTQVTTDAAGNETLRVRWIVQELPSDAFALRFRRALAAHADVIFLGPENPDLDDAKQAVHDGGNDFADHMAIAADHTGFQRWDEAWESWAKARASLDGKPGVDWIELGLLAQSRQGERLVDHVQRLADALAKSRDSDARPLAFALFTQGTPFQVNERLEILDLLVRAGVDDDIDVEDAWWDAQWRQQRAGLLLSAHRYDEAIALYRALHTDHPDDVQYAVNVLNALTQARRVDAALEFLDSLDTSAPPWNEYLVRNAYYQIMQVTWNAMRFDEVLRLADRWMASDATNAQAYQARLGALLGLGRANEFDAWVGAQLDAAGDAGEDREARAQLQAAVSAALGNEWNGSWYGHSLDAKWEERLVEVARVLAIDPKADANVVSTIVNRRWYGYSDGTDLRRRLIDALRDQFVADGVIESLPAQRVAYYRSWLPWGRTEVDADVWRNVTDRVVARWRAEEDRQQRAMLFGVALGLLDGYVEPTEAADLIREALASAPPEEVPGHANMLLTRLVQLPWTPEVEDEIFALVPRVTMPDATKTQETQAFAPMARWVADRLFALQVEALLGPPEEREKLPRAELRANQKTARTTARRALAERFRTESASASETLRPWYEIERICFLAESGEDPAAAEGEAREMLLSIASGDDGDDGWRWVLRERSVLALSYLALRRNAPEGLPERLVALLVERLEKDADALDWRYAIFRLLVALDRPAELETALSEWIVPSQVESRWRIALGYLVAEMERLDEAVALFEEVAKLDELDESGYVSLADWYLVLGDDARRESTLDRRYRVVDENTLAQYVSQERYRLQSRNNGDGVPLDMDEEVLRMLRVLLAKSSQPQHRLYEVRNLYRPTKDFRILAVLADGVVGHTPQSIYPYLQQTSNIVQDVHEEATCDELRTRIQARLPDAKTDTDRRALQLLMSQVERRAAEVLDQPGPHIERSLHHLQQARKGAWLPGEKRLMADYLAALGKIPHQSLADEQLSQLRELHDLSDRGTDDRLRIALALHATEWGYDLRDSAIDGLKAALDEHREAKDGVLPESVNDIVNTHISWYEATQRFGAGEAALLAEHDRQTSSSQRQWYERRVFALYANCLYQGGTVSLGAGADLYRAARDQMERALVDHEPDFIAEILGTYLTLHRSAHDRAKVPGVADDIVRFSQTLLPELLPRFGQNQGSQVQQVAEAVRDIAGTLAAVTFVVERLEAEPEWFRRRNADTWRHVSGRLAQWRRELGGKIGDVAPRLLAIVLRELERDLVSKQSHGRSMYGGKTSHEFWKEKESEFVAVVNRVIDEHAENAGILHHVAQYLWGDLRLYADAIKTLQDADTRGALVRDGRWTLVGWLEHEKRWQDMLPHIEQLVREWPDELQYRLANVRALHALSRDNEGKALVDATREHFDALGSATGANQALAQLCLTCEYFARSVELFELAIPEHERRTRGQRRDGDGQLANMYGSLARAHAGLGQYDEAVDAASSAVVVMGPSQRNRRQALSALTSVLTAIPDLPAWTKQYEEQAAETGLDAPVIRRALAEIHLTRKEPEAALRHLRIALRHTPEDVLLHQQMIEACRQQKDDRATATALAASLAHVPAQPDLYPQLAELLRGLGDDTEAERALTGLVEYAPNEADGHRRLAAIRAAAERHADAVVQWQQVVRTRPLEPAGWLELARAQARAGDVAAAHATLDALLETKGGSTHRKAVEQVSKDIDAQRGD